MLVESHALTKHVPWGRLAYKLRGTIGGKLENEEISVKFRHQWDHLTRIKKPNINN